MAKNAAGRSNWNTMSEASLDLQLADSPGTEALGVALARALPDRRAGAVVHLHGELGTGKTTCVRSILRALGVTGPVRSPTYTLVDTYVLADLTCVHIDLYRLQSVSEVEELGLADLSGPGYLMLIEWPEKGGSRIPSADVQLMLRYAPEGRSASLHAGSVLGGEWLRKLGFDTRLMPYVSNLT
jgi:tRNA threonylcarbamoyladenosine biosynthesis protein TsaE